MKFLNASIVLLALISSSNAHKKHEKGKLLRGRRDVESPAFEIELNQKEEHLRALKHTSTSSSGSTKSIGSSGSSKSSTSSGGGSKSSTSSGGSKGSSGSKGDSDSKIKSVKCGSKKGGSSGSSLPCLDLGGNFITKVNTPVSFEIALDNRMNADGDAPTTTSTIESFTQPENGSLIQSANMPGSFVYTPSSEFVGTDTFEYTVVDGLGTVSTGIATIIVEAINNPPRAINDTFDVMENGDMVIDASQLLANDIDPDGDVLQISGCTDPQNGQIKTKKDGSFTYTPNDNFLGTDSVICTITDGRGGTDTSEVMFTVKSPGFTVDDTYTTEMGQPIISSAPGILANDQAGNDVLVVESCSTPNQGDLAFDAQGGFEYTPPAGFVGVASFECNIINSRGGLDTSQVTINVVPASDIGTNSSPMAVNDSYTTDENIPLTVDGGDLRGVLSNDSDPDGDTLEVVSFTQPSHGTVSIVGDGRFTYLPEQNWNGVDTFQYIVSDGNDGQATGTVTITVTPADGASALLPNTIANVKPTAVDDSYSTSDNTPLQVSQVNGILSNDSDPDGDSLTITSFTRPLHGTVTLEQNGAFIYTPNENWNGQDTFEYIVSDSKGGADTGTVTISVTPFVAAVDDEYTTFQGTVLSIPGPGVLDNDRNFDSISEFTQPQHGQVDMNPDGSFIYTPAPGFVGTDVFEYTLVGSNGFTATGKVSLKVQSMNVPPLINPTNGEVILIGGEEFAVAGASSDCNGKDFMDCDNVSTASTTVGK